MVAWLRRLWRCDLFYLKNDVTAAAQKLGYNWSEPPSVVAERIR